MNTSLQMALYVRCWVARRCGDCTLLLLLAGCAPDAAEVGFYSGGLDARVLMPDELAVADAASDAQPVDAEPAAPPGAEVRRLAGFSAAHNAARARLQTSPALKPLVWSSEIALVAQAYAQTLAGTCLDTLTHSSPEARHNWGENIASYAIQGGSGLEPNGSSSEVVALWESELACYTFGPFESGTNATCTAACAQYGGCGHYTQLVWRTTTRFGCGVADCTQGSWRKSYWVCNYDPPGNVLGRYPY